MRIIARALLGSQTAHYFKKLQIIRFCHLIAGLWATALSTFLLAQLIISRSNLCVSLFFIINAWTRILSKRRRVANQLRLSSSELETSTLVHILQRANKPLRPRLLRHILPKPGSTLEEDPTYVIVYQIRHLYQSVRKLDSAAKSTYFYSIISESLSSPKFLWKTVNMILHRDRCSVLPLFLLISS